MELKLDAETAARLAKQADDGIERAFLAGFSGAPGESDAGDGFATSMAELVGAIKQGAILPLEFKPLIDQHVDSEIAKLARYEPRASLMARMSGNVPGAAQPLGTDSTAPQRRIDPLTTQMPGGDVTTRIPNSYRGPLDDFQPRLDPPRTRWGA
jgi:hypothetical protein